ncbi:MAG: ATP-binding cassette domain-containing protein, partial [Geminicoccaceae bacterium]|nr:ATP-binding cassette domain-containing protein [Geminicoccaceae bacterium]
MPDDVLAAVDRVVVRFAGDEAAALAEVTARIGAGRITGLVGPDGAGKTTMLRLLTGLLLPTSGSVQVFGIDTAGAAAERIRADIGYMPQRFGLYEDLSVAENLNLYADLRGLPADERAATFERLLRFTDLARFRERLAGALSGGMKQKLGLACALLRRPRLLLLDEPSVGVDPISRRELWSMVHELTADGIGVLWSTAYLDEAEKCERVLLLNEGALLFDGPPGALSSRVAGRVFLVEDVPGRKREVLAEALADPALIDGVIQGRALRLVLRDAGAKPAVEGVFRPAAPRFEDGFVDVLGGGPGGRSRLAGAMESRPPGGEVVIRARGLTRRFGDFTAARDITFDIERGEIFGLLGPNGAGKSTTFKMLCGLLRPSEGSGRVAGFDLVREGAEARNRLGYMAQKF